MPKAKTPTKPPAAKATPKKEAKPAKSAAAPEKVAAEIAPVAPAKPVKAPPQHPGKPEPSWAKFNQGGHAQKMSKGRPFRHQGR